MKHLFTLCLTLFLVTCFSQGNLQFNQVKLVSTQETVPAGKVWRVDSYAYNGGGAFAGTLSAQYSMDGSNTYSSLNLIGSYIINGQTNQIPISFSRGSVNGLVSVELNLFPFWLPTGSTLAAGTNLRHLSVVEFNIIP